MGELPGDLTYTKEHEWLRQEEDGSVVVPEALLSYMGGVSRLEAQSR